MWPGFAICTVLLSEAVHLKGGRPSHGSQFWLVHDHVESQFSGRAIKRFEDCFDVFDGCGRKQNVIHKSVNAFLKPPLKFSVEVEKRSMQVEDEK